MPEILKKTPQNHRIQPRLTSYWKSQKSEQKCIWYLQSSMTYPWINNIIMTMQTNNRLKMYLLWKNGVFVFFLLCFLVFGGVLYIIDLTTSPSPAPNEITLILKNLQPTNITSHSKSESQHSPVLCRIAIDCQFKLMFNYNHEGPKDRLEGNT